MRNMLDVVASAVDDVLHLGQGDAPCLPLREAAFEVRACLDEEVGWFVTKAHAKGLDLTCSIADDVPVMLHGDAARLRQILRVLLDNALKYTVCGGVAVAASWTAVEETTAKDGDERIAGQTSGRARAGHLTLDVADSGPGVPAGMENAVFSAFSRADRETPGVGLGLWIARQWAQRLGGVLRAEPSSTGAHFRLSVPFAPFAAAALSTPCAPFRSFGPDRPDEPDGPVGPLDAKGPVAPIAAAGAAAAPETIAPRLATGGTPAPWPAVDPGEVPVVDVGVRRGLRAMVVDDHVMNRAVLADQLGALGCEVHRAADFTEALLRWITDDFDVVLTDIQLGEGSGLTLAKSLHVLGPVLARRVPVVLAITGSVVSARAAREAGLDGVLTKPVSRQRLTQALAARWPSFGEAGDADSPDRVDATTSRAAGRGGGRTGADPTSSSGGRGITALRDDPYARRLMRGEMAKDLARFRRLLAGRRDEDLTAAQEVVHRMRGACRMFGDPALIARCDHLAGKLAEKLAARGGALAADATDTGRQR
ncbi:hypothetical protein RO07_25445 [Pandoraea pulmonicola]|nr:hypothetical protein RO07_25445 [Pandoraea pulmonicola]